MPNNKWIYITIIALIALVAILVIKPSCSTSAHAAALMPIAIAEPGPTIEITPSTQPATDVGGVLVQPPPSVKVTSPGKDPWGIADILVAIAAILGVISIVVVPAALMLIGKLGEVRTAVKEAFGKNEDNAARLDRQGQRVSDLEKAQDPTKTPPPA